MAQCSIFVGQMARCNIVVGQMAQCSIFMGQISSGQMAQCSIVVGQMAQCSIIVGQMAQCSIIVGQMAQCSIVVGQMAQCSIFMDQEIFARMTSTTKACFNVFLHLGSASNIVERTEATYRSKIQIPNSGEVTLWLSMHFFPHPPSARSPFFRGHLANANGGTHQGTPSDFKTGGHQASRPNIRFCIFSSLGSSSCPGKPFKLWTSHLSSLYQLTQQTSALPCLRGQWDFHSSRQTYRRVRNTHQRTAQLPGQKRGFARGPKTGPSGCPCDIHGLSTETREGSWQSFHDPLVYYPHPSPFARTPTHTPSHTCAGTWCVGRLMMVGVDARISRADLLLENVLVYPRSATQPVVILACFRELPTVLQVLPWVDVHVVISWHATPPLHDAGLASIFEPAPIVSDARQLLSLLIVKGQTEQTTWVTYITQRGPTFLVREARFGYTVPVITQPLAQFLARQGLLINAVFATAGVRDAFMTLVGVISVDPTGVAAKQLPLPFGGTCMADWWKFPQSEAALRLFNVRTDVPIFCNGVQVRHDICPVVWTMPDPSWCPCQWADTEKELYLGSLLVKSFIISPRAVYTVGTRFPPLLDYLRSRQPQIHVPEECLLHGPPARPERHSYHPAGVAPRRSTTVCLRVLKGGLAI
ncbi:hypothetical protein PAPYR_12137 [Paratrimastix pyriformis]|uniref:Uncharacterized protein n=1 Tax=Paratrimastix pyriformis TaxID=342808 RepID=A0ABQ8U7S9_9EUKA|nr:hypothetical protein PAPYR_12137 [Paratrimastix pyriformis]